MTKCEKILATIMLVIVILIGVVVTVPSVRNSTLDSLAKYSPAYRKQEKELKAISEELEETKNNNAILTTTVLNLRNEKNSLDLQKRQIEAQYEEGLITIEERNATINEINGRLSDTETKIDNLIDRLNIDLALPDYSLTWYKTNGTKGIVELPVSNCNVDSNWLWEGVPTDEEIAVRFSCVDGLFLGAVSHELDNATVFIYDEGVRLGLCWRYLGDNAKNVKEIYFPYGINFANFNSFCNFDDNGKVYATIYLPAEHFDEMKTELLSIEGKSFDEDKIKPYSLDELNAKYPVFDVDLVGKIDLIDNYISSQNDTIAQLEAKIAELNSIIKNNNIALGTGTGLYSTGTNDLLYSWTELIDSGKIVISDGDLQVPDKELNGDLVFPEIDNVSIINFRNCSSLTNIDLAKIDTRNVTSFDCSFEVCRSLTSLNLSNFDTSTVTSMIAMFEDCSSLTTLCLDSFDTSNVSNMSNMFSGCSSLTSLDLSNFDTSSVTSMAGMFSNCRRLSSLNLCNFNTRNVTDLYVMFAKCSSLTFLDLSNFDTSNVTNMTGLFNDCISLEHLNLTGFDFSKVTAFDRMFYGVPTDCEIYVGSQEALEWITTNFPELTNVTLKA